MVAPYLSRLIALPFVLLIVYYFAYGQFQSAYLDEIILIPSMIILVLLYVFNEQINRWWWTVRPLTLEPRVKSWIETYSPFYNALDSDAKQTAESQISRLMLTKEYTLKGKKDFQLEEDMKAMIAHEMYRLIQDFDTSYTFPSCQHVVMYNHPFATPDYQYLHSVEFNREDGVLILARDAAINGFNAGLDHFNIVLFGVISIFIHENPRLSYPSTKELTSEIICEKLDISHDSIKGHLGDMAISSLALLIYCSVEYPEKMKTSYQEEYETIKGLFKI